MAKVNIARLKKDEIVFLYNHHCKHGHRYLEHYGCYLIENPERKEIGFFDIETSNLKADFGIILSYSFLHDRTGLIHSDLVTAKDLRGLLDKRVVTNLVEDMKKYDLVVGYYSTKFDVPFARTRAKITGVEFPAFGEIQHKDVYYIVRNKFALSRNRQEIAARMLVGKTDKTYILPDQWLRALSGDRKALAYILDHNEKDVRDLQKLYHEVIPFVKNTTTSI